MNRRWMCGDIWLNILPFFDHAKLGLNLALLSDRYDALVDKHFNGKTEFTLWRRIKIDKGEGPKSKLSVLVDDKLVEFPLPHHSLPNKIRFKDLYIEYIDHSVIEFMRSNKHIWDRSGTKLGLDVRTIEPKDNQPIWDVLASEIWPVFATNIRHLCFYDDNHLDNLRRRTSPTLLTDLDHLNAIESTYLLPDAIVDDGTNATVDQALSKWLHTPTKDGQPKKFCSCFALMEEINNWFDNHKQTFLRATTSVSYYIQLIFYKTTTQIEPFELVNERTNERLTLVENGDAGCEIISAWLLKRCPIIAAAFQKDDNLYHLNGIYFNLGGNCIGRAAAKNWPYFCIKYGHDDDSRCLRQQIKATNLFPGPVIRGRIRSDHLKK